MWQTLRDWYYDTWSGPDPIDSEGSVRGDTASMLRSICSHVVLGRLILMLPGAHQPATVVIPWCAAAALLLTGRLRAGLRVALILLTMLVWVQGLNGDPLMMSLLLVVVALVLGRAARWFEGADPVEMPSVARLVKRAVIAVVLAAGALILIWTFDVLADAVTWRSGGDISPALLTRYLHFTAGARAGRGWISVLAAAAVALSAASVVLAARKGMKRRAGWMTSITIALAAVPTSALFVSRQVTRWEDAWVASHRDAFQGALHAVNMGRRTLVAIAMMEERVQSLPLEAELDARAVFAIAAETPEPEAVVDVLALWLAQAAPRLEAGKPPESPPARSIDRGSCDRVYALMGSDRSSGRLSIPDLEACRREERRLGVLAKLSELDVTAAFEAKLGAGGAEAAQGLRSLFVHRMVALLATRQMHTEPWTVGDLGSARAWLRAHAPRPPAGGPRASGAEWPWRLRAQDADRSWSADLAATSMVTHLATNPTRYQ